MVQLLWKTVWRFLKKLKIGLSYDPTSKYISKRTENRNMKRYLHAHVYSSINQAVKRWKQSMDVSIVGWMDKRNVINTYNEYYSALKRKEILTYVTRMKLKDIVISEISQSQKDKCCMIALIWGQIHKDRKQKNGRCQDLGGRGVGSS